MASNSSGQKGQVLQYRVQTAAATNGVAVLTGTASAPFYAGISRIIKVEYASGTFPGPYNVGAVSAAAGGASSGLASVNICCSNAGGGNAGTAYVTWVNDTPFTTVNS